MTTMLFALGSRKFLMIKLQLLSEHQCLHLHKPFHCSSPCSRASHSCESDSKRWLGSQAVDLTQWELATDVKVNCIGSSYPLFVPFTGLALWSPGIWALPGLATRSPGRNTRSSNHPLSSFKRQAWGIEFPLLVCYSLLGNNSKDSSTNLKPN